MRYGAVLLTILISIGVYVIAGLTLSKHIGGQADLIASNRRTIAAVRASVKRIDALVVTQNRAAAQLQALRGAQLGAVRNGLLDRCHRANRVNAALLRILRTLTKTTRRTTTFKRRSALRTYERAFIRLQPVNCEQAYPPVQP